MDERQMKGLEIAATVNLEKRADGTWSVPSQTGSRTRYAVNPMAKNCTCPDFETRGLPCKHVFAVELVLKRETVTETTDAGTVTTTTETAEVRVTYTQDWPAYNASQVNEKAHFTTLLAELCATVPSIEQNNGRRSGRNRLPLSDMLFAAGFKVYSTCSARRFMTDLRDAQERGCLSKTPHYNSIFNYLEMEELTPIIQTLITQSALPLKAIETDWAPDSTGFTTTQLVGTWRQEKYGVKSHRVDHDWVKLHGMCGVVTNVVSHAEVTDHRRNDTTQFAPMVEATAANFNMEKVMADKAYSTHANLELVRAHNAMPFIPFKSYAVASGKSATWDKMLGFYLMHRAEFLQSYNKRSNAESTFSAIKRVFGDFIRSKTPVAQVNEVLLKVLAHNLRCVIRSMYALGIDPSFCATPVPAQKVGLLC